MENIFIGKEHLAEVIAHSKESFPKEACGIMAGRGNVVERVYGMQNADDSTVTYRFDPEEQLKVMKEIKEAGLEMVAVYHSHTGSPAYPSGTDIERAFFPGTRDESYPGVVFVIVGLGGEEPEIKAFLLGKEIRRVQIKSDRA